MYVSVILFAFNFVGCSNNDDKNKPETTSPAKGVSMATYLEGQLVRGFHEANGYIYAFADNAIVAYTQNPLGELTEVARYDQPEGIPTTLFAGDVGNAIFFGTDTNLCIVDRVEDTISIFSISAGNPQPIFVKTYDAEGILGDPDKAIRHLAVHNGIPYVVTDRSITAISINPALNALTKVAEYGIEQINPDGID